MKGSTGIVWLAIVAAYGGAFPAALAAAGDAAPAAIIEEVVVVGTRGKPRSVSDSPVPVDVISAERFNAIGNGFDITDNLRTLVPSYTATPATGDGSAFVRPTSLRGTAPDQMLVLVNGKRRHRSALVHFLAPAAGNGAHGVDVGMIPSIALKRVEVLRDGAAAQYGSDAIAGVLNFVTRDASQGGQLNVQYGQFYEGEQSMKVAGNIGLPLRASGFVNASVEYINNDALSRGVQRPDAQALQDSGIPVGLDAPFGDSPLVQSWGRPANSGTKMFINSGYDLSDSRTVYARLGWASTTGRFRFFYRPPDHSSLAPLRAAGFTGLPGGYTPYLDGDQRDLSVAVGMRGVTTNAITYDVSYSRGRNQLDYYLYNTINQDTGLTDGQPTQRNFDVGGYEQLESAFNADLSMPVRNNLLVSFGGEYRKETYTANAGEPNSYIGAGANGLNGINPRDAGKFDRSNWAIYGDVEHNINAALMLQYALRLEKFSDFGTTTNGKIAGLFRATDRVALRGAISTGFHAPTPGQANVRTTITTFDGITGEQIEEGLVPSTDPRVASLGGKALKQEESVNFSVGATGDMGRNTSLTVDFYQINVNDRIYRTRNLDVPGTNNGISFYTNALDVRHRGVDLVLTSLINWNPTITTDITLAYSHNEIKVTGQGQVGGVNPVGDDLVEDIENNYPTDRFTLTTNTRFSDQLTLMMRANFYGQHYDERGRINAAVNPTGKIDPTIYVDLEFSYQFNKNVRFAVGGINVLDNYVNKIGPPNANRLSVGLPYPRRTPANYEGGSWYLKGVYSF